MGCRNSRVAKPLTVAAAPGAEATIVDDPAAKEKANQEQVASEPNVEIEDTTVVCSMCSPRAKQAADGATVEAATAEKVTAEPGASSAEAAPAAVAAVTTEAAAKPLEATPASAVVGAKEPETVVEIEDKAITCDFCTVKTDAPVAEVVAAETAEEKAAAEKKAAQEKAAAEKKEAEDRAVADQKAAVEKAAAEKQAAEERAAVEKKVADEKAEAGKKVAAKNDA